MIASVLLPFFAAAIERQLQPGLQGQPLLIVSSGREGVRVAALCAAAAGAGVRPGMALREGLARCPEARTTQASPARYQQVLETLLALLARYSRHVEPAGGPWLAARRWQAGPGLGQSALCFVRLEHGWGSAALELAQELGEALRTRLGLAPAIGLATGKFPAHVAAASLAPNEVLIVAPGSESAFLAPLPARLLPLTEEQARRLSLLGLRTLGQLAELNPAALQSQLGAQARLLWQLARGQDPRPVRPFRPQQQQRLRRRFDGALADRHVLELALRQLAEQLAARLQSAGYAGRELALLLQLEDGSACELQLTLRHAVTRSSHLAQALAGLLARAQLAQGVVEVTVLLGGLLPATGEQLDLFIHGRQQQRRLRAVLQDLIARYGPDCFYRAVLAQREERLPERGFALEPIDEE